jgi:RNAse (barnase) inhibitor barstar
VVTTMSTPSQHRVRVTGASGALCAVGKPKLRTLVITQPITMQASARSCRNFRFCNFESEAGMNMSLSQETPAPSRAPTEVPLRGIRPNIVQSIRAFRVQELQDAAQTLGQHFLYAHLANAQTKQDVLDLIGQQFKLSAHVGKNFDALYDSMTDPLHKSGPQPGFIVVLEHIPANTKFDKEAREQLLDIFRDAADYWGDRKIPFRCFYSFL